MPSLFRKMDTRRLHSSDIKNIVRILRNDPQSSMQHEGEYHDIATESAIKKLPRRLRSSPLSSHGALCRSHKGLDAYLIDDIWAWIKYELEVAIGRFLYPIIMSEILSEQDERRARQLEPVVRMFNPNWTLAESSPPGILPIDAGDKWVFQKNGCPGCMLARLGSDEDALFALFAGMYGHLRSRSGGQKGVDKIKSKRLRFVRYWMRTHLHGEQKSLEAYDLGVEMKALRFDAKASLRHSGKRSRYTRDNHDEPPANARHCLDEQPVAVMDISDPYNPKDWSIPNDPKIGPEPPLDCTKQFVVEERHNKPLPATPRASAHIQPPTPHAAHHSTQPSTHSIEDDDLPPLPVLSRANLKRRDSVLSTTSTLHPPRHPASSTYSSPSRLTLATSIASFNNATTSSHAHRHDPMDTPEERLDKYRKLLNQAPVNRGANKWEGVRAGTVRDVNVGKGTVEFYGRLLPKPSRASMYSAFGEEGRDGREFDVVDVSPPLSPGFELEGGPAEDEDDVDVDLHAFASRKREH